MKLGHYVFLRGLGPQPIDHAFYALKVTTRVLIKWYELSWA